MCVSCVCVCDGQGGHWGEPSASPTFAARQRSTRRMISFSESCGCARPICRCRSFHVEACRPFIPTRTSRSAMTAGSAARKVPDVVARAVVNGVAAAERSTDLATWPSASALVMAKSPGNMNTLNSRPPSSRSNHKNHQGKTQSIDKGSEPVSSQHLATSPRGDTPG